MRARVPTGECAWEQWAAGSVGRRFGDDRGGALVVAEDRVLYDTDRDLVLRRLHPPTSSARGAVGNE